MPRKPKDIKKTKKYNRRPYNKRRKFRQTKEVMINRMPKSSHSVVAPHYYTSLEGAFYGNIGVTGGTSAGQFFVCTNNCETPFHDGTAGNNSFTDMTGATLSPGTHNLTGLKTAGFSKLAAIYKAYRVYKYMVYVVATPTNNSDIIGLSLVPVGGVDLPNVLGLSQQEIMSLPYSKSIMCSANNNLIKNKVSQSMMPRTILGLNKLQYKDEIDTSAIVGSGPPSIPTFVVVTYNTLDGADLGAKLFFEVKIRFWLEFFDPITDMTVT